jgi:hypothetical protein
LRRQESEGQTIALASWLADYDTMRLGQLLCVTFSLAIAFAAPRTETGEINGAKFRIDVPEN